MLIDNFKALVESDEKQFDNIERLNSAEVSDLIGIFTNNLRQAFTKYFRYYTPIIKHNINEEREYIKVGYKDNLYIFTFIKPIVLKLLGITNEKIYDENYKTITKRFKEIINNGNNSHLFNYLYDGFSITDHFEIQFDKDCMRMITGFKPKGEDIKDAFRGWLFDVEFIYGKQKDLILKNIVNILETIICNEINIYNKSYPLKIEGDEFNYIYNSFKDLEDSCIIENPNELFKINMFKELDNYLADSDIRDSLGYTISTREYLFIPNGHLVIG